MAERRPPQAKWGCLDTPCDQKHDVVARATEAWQSTHTRAVETQAVVTRAPKEKPVPPPIPFTPLHPDGHPRFAKSVWPKLHIGTKIIVLRGGKHSDAVVLDTSDKAIQIDTSRGRFIYQFDEIAGIYWHPDETGDGIREELASAAAAS